ncbi:MAG: hypothetical protein WC348_03145 [Patescibacteria group bacterium]|jgi:uncharacterized membrane protein
MEFIPLISIAIEGLVALLSAVAAFRGRSYMYGLAFTFAIYVFYDLAKLYGWGVPQNVLSVIFLVATLSALASVWQISRRR